MKKRYTAPGEKGSFFPFLLPRTDTVYAGAGVCSRVPPFFFSLDAGDYGSLAALFFFPEDKVLYE